MITLTIIENVHKKIHKIFIWFLGGMLFLGTFRVYYASVVRDRGDSRYVLHVANSILHEQNTNLDEYKWLIEKEGIYKTRTFVRNNHIYSIYPIGTTLLTVPVVALYDWYTVHFIDPVGVDKHIVLSQTDKLDNFIAAFFTAAAICMIFVVGLTMVPWHFALLGSISIAFGTSAWTSAARTLWPHGPTMLMLVLGLWLLIKARQYPKLVLFAQLPLAYSFYIRPTNLIPLFLFSLYIFFRYRKLWFYSFFACLLILLPLFFYNIRIYGNILSPFYYPGGISMGPYTHTFRFAGEGLAGLLISPNRGLFIFSSFIVFSFVGMVLLIKRKKARMFEYLLFITIILHWVVISTYQGWWGGWGFGPRYFTDILPIFGYFIFIFFREVVMIQKKTVKFILLGSFLLTVTISIWIYHSGAMYYSTMYWDGYPTNIDFHSERVWDWTDLQFLRRK